MYIEDRIKILEEQVSESKKIIEELRDQSTRQTGIICNLINGLFYKDTQKEYKQLLYDILHREKDFSDILESNITICQQQPTTIQCEAIEDTIEYIQCLINTLDNRVKELEK